MRSIVGSITAAALALVIAGCGSDDAPVTEAPAPSPPTETAAAPERTDVGTIEARITYAGSPVVETLRIARDPEQCGTEATVPRIAVGDDGGLRHAVVSVAGLEGPPTARTVPQMDQQGCEFRPRVMAMTPGEIEILNSDGILHNIHTYSEANAPINKAQPGFRKVMTETFAEPEIVRVTCDIHSWMAGWIAVMPNPYFGVTDPSGIARIEDVPAGSHTLEIWHEELGRQTLDVTVGVGETTEVAFEFPQAG